MTLQEIFDKAAEHLLKQNERSVLGSCPGRCAYRGDWGRKCAVGAFIDDKHYHMSLEGEGAWSRAVIAALEQSMGIKVGVRETDLFTALQSVHDDSDPTEWPGNLRGVAKRFQLSTAKLGELAPPPAATYKPAHGGYPGEVSHA